MGEYVFDSASDLGREQLECLENLLDGPTRDFLTSLDLRPGARCLDLGAGNGSVTRWMARHLAVPDRVSVVDIDDAHLDVPAGVTVHRHDINEGLPTGGGFDLIHARMLLMHLKRRREILEELVDALEPGGWLVIGDQAYTGARVLSAPTPADDELYRSIVDTAVNKMARAAGIDAQWAGTVDVEMTAAGLVEIDTMTYDRTLRGGTAGMTLMGNYIRQAEAPLLSLGVSASELRRFYEVVRDSRMRAWWFPLFYTRGRKPGQAS